MTDLSAFIAECWDEHAADAPAVALKLPHGLDRVADEGGLISLATLAHHVYGEHLAAWSDGLKYLAALGRLPAFDVHGRSGQSLLRCRASLALAAGEGDARATLSASDRIAVTAMAAVSLSPHDPARAATLWGEAVGEAEQARLAADDPAQRTLAVSGNNLASALEMKPARTAAETDLMLAAARVARRCWALAGGWLEIERADYRLASSLLAAGQLAEARQHARACLDGVGAQPEAAALERFFAWEVIGRVERAAGDADAHRQALDQARAAFGALDDGDRSWCADSLDKLAAPA